MSEVLHTVCAFSKYFIVVMCCYEGGGPQLHAGQGVAGCYFILRVSSSHQSRGSLGFQGKVRH